MLLINMTHDLFLLLIDKLIDGPSKGGVFDEVSTLNQSRSKAAQILMLPLGTGLKEIESIANSDVDTSVEAELKVKKGDIFDGTPVAAKERCGRLEKEGRGNGLLIFIVGHQQGENFWLLTIEIGKELKV